MSRYVSGTMAFLLCGWLTAACNAEYQVRLRLAVTDADGSVIQTAAVGDEFVLRGYVKDLRDEPQGVFAAYLDVSYTSNTVSAVGPIAHGEAYQNGKSGSLGAAGEVDEIGAFDGTAPLDGEERLLFSIPFRAVSPGEVSFVPNAADSTPSHDVLVFGVNDPVSPNSVEYVGTQVTVEGNPDLLIDQISIVDPVDPNDWRSAVPLTAKVKVKNAGTVTASRFDVSIWSDASGEPNGLTSRTAFQELSDLSPGEMKEATFALTYSTCGSHTIWAKADAVGTVAEGSPENELNNADSMAIEVICDEPERRLTVSPKEVEARTSGSSVSIYVSNTGEAGIAMAWTAEVVSEGDPDDPNDPNWLRIDPSCKSGSCVGGETPQQIILLYDTNAGGTRIGRIRVTAQDGTVGSPIEVTVTQPGTICFAVLPALVFLLCLGFLSISKGENRGFKKVEGCSAPFSALDTPPRA